MPPTRWERRAGTTPAGRARSSHPPLRSRWRWKASAWFLALWWRALPRVRHPDEKISRPTVGHVKMGLLYTVPNRSVRISTLVASRSRRGRNWTCLNPSRLARRVASSSTPLAMYAQWTGIDLAARGFLKIHHVESLFRIGDDLGDLRRPLRECTDSAKRGDVGAPGQILKKGPAVMGRKCWTLHDVYFRCAASSFSRA